MTTQIAPPHTRPVKPQPTRAARDFGYMIAIGINAGMLYVAHNLLDWNWASWLTDDFTKVLPILTVSLVATMLVNFVYMAYDHVWFKSLTQIGLLALSLLVTARIWQVFPFDFSSFDFAWTGLTRAVLVASFFGIALGMIAELVRLAGSWIAGDAE